MIITPTPENIAFFGALASDVRLKIIQLLSKEELNIKELADRIGVSSPIMLKHVQTLENAGVVTSRLVKRNGSTSRVCTLVFAEYRFLIESRRLDLPSVYTVSMPVGHYFDIEGSPTCGLATEKNVIGFRDDPRVFWEPDRVNAQLLWFTQGFVEYRMPNYLSAEQKVVEIELSFEIASEAP
ncbi:MAG: helix-turn-helix domain-containing protein, partial [Clostridiales bacterium]|nr:helix-turn-helix domain-containing protein [Clostridiales bacterium]